MCIIGAHLSVSNRKFGGKLFVVSGDMENDSKRFRTAPHHTMSSPHHNQHHVTHHHHQYLQSHSGAITMTSQSADLSNHKRAITPLGTFSDDWDYRSLKCALRAREKLSNSISQITDGYLLPETISRNIR